MVYRKGRGQEASGAGYAEGARGGERENSGQCDNESGSGGAWAAPHTLSWRITQRGQGLVVGRAGEGVGLLGEVGWRRDEIVGRHKWKENRQGSGRAGPQGMH